MIAKLWHHAMVAIGVRAPANWTPGMAELFAAEMNAAAARAMTSIPLGERLAAADFAADFNRALAAASPRSGPLCPPAPEVAPK